MQIQDVSQVVGVETVDLAIATSLFTHLDFQDALPILREIASALKLSGYLFMTCFVVDNTARNAIERTSKAKFSFRYVAASGKALIDRADVPSHAVGFSPAQLDALLNESGLVLIEHTPGYWCGAQNRIPFQDVVVAKKAAQA